jgi:hypothetical protein
MEYELKQTLPTGECKVCNPEGNGGKINLRIGMKRAIRGEKAGVG